MRSWSPNPAIAATEECTLGGASDRAKASLEAIRADYKSTEFALAAEYGIAPQSFKGKQADQCGSRIT